MAIPNQPLRQILGFVFENLPTCSIRIPFHQRRGLCRFLLPTGPRNGLSSAHFGFWKLPHAPGRGRPWARFASWLKVLTASPCLAACLAEVTSRFVFVLSKEDENIHEIHWNPEFGNLIRWSGIALANRRLYQHTDLGAHLTYIVQFLDDTCSQLLISSCSPQHVFWNIMERVLAPDIIILYHILTFGEHYVFQVSGIKLVTRVHCC